MKTETKCIHAGYAPANTEPRVKPIVQSTTYVFDSAADIGAVFDDPTKALIYSRFANPTVMAVEDKIAALEGGAGAMCTSSGQAATLLAILNLCSAGDHLVCTSSVYGGTLNLLSFTFRRLGIECSFVDARAPEAELDAAMRPNTKLVFGESIANPSLVVLDFEKLARVAHRHGVPLIVDNTIATPALCRPFEHGADIIVHSTSKYMDGHALQVGGAIVDSGKFDWAAGGRFPGLTEPDESYHGVVYTEVYGNLAYIIKARMQLMRDFGCYPSAHSAFLLNLGLDTLAVRMDRYCENALAVAQYFEKHPKVESVTYPGLPGARDYALCQKYTGGRASAIIALTLRGGKDAAVRFMDSLRLAHNEIHLADICTSVLHPATSTHRQLNEAQQRAAGVDPSMIRFSVGLEHIDDILADIEQAFAK